MLTILIEAVVAYVIVEKTPVGDLIDKTANVIGDIINTPAEIAEFYESRM